MRENRIHIIPKNFFSFHFVNSEDANDTSAQLRHNDFRIFADRSSRNNSENGKTLVIYLTVL